MKIDVGHLVGSDVLAGTAAGIAVLGKLASATIDCSDSTVVFLDFQHVQVATASFLREAVIGFRNRCRRRRTQAYPVMANANESVEEEMRLVATSLGEPFVLCKTDQRMRVRDSWIVGRLEHKQLETLMLVERYGETDAVKLAESCSDSGIGPTGWNNRLATLCAKGMLIELRSRTRKVYTPILKGIRYGR